MDTILVIALTEFVSNSPGLSNIFFVNIHTYSKQPLPLSSPSPRRIFRGVCFSQIEIPRAYISLRGICTGLEGSLVCDPSNGATVDRLMSEFD